MNEVAFKVIRGRRQIGLFSAGFAPVAKHQIDGPVPNRHGILESIAALHVAIDGLGVLEGNTHQHQKSGEDGHDHYDGRA